MRRFNKTVDAVRPAKGLTSVRRTRTPAASDSPVRRKRAVSIPFASKPKTRKPIKTTAAPPPVLVRNQQIGTPVRQRIGGKQRKRVDVALPLSGAEVRLPSLPRIHIGWRIVSLFLVIFLGGMIAFLWTAPMFTVEAAQVGGAERVTAEDINLVLGITGRSIFSIDRNDVYTNVIGAFPEMKAITVEISLPAVISVTVDERTPLISWRAGDQELWVDESGMAFPPRGTVDGLVLVRSQMELPENLDEPIVDPQTVSALLKVGAYIPAGAPIVFDTEHGVGWQDPHGWLVYFGHDLSEITIKLKVYQVVANKVIADGIFPKFISVEFIDAPYYRVEP